MDKIFLVSDLNLCSCFNMTAITFKTKKETNHILDQGKNKLLENFSNRPSEPEEEMDM